MLITLWLQTAFGLPITSDTVCKFWSRTLPSVSIYSIGNTDDETTTPMSKIFPVRKNMAPGYPKLEDMWSDEEARKKGWGSGIKLGHAIKFTFHGFQEGYTIAYPLDKNGTHIEGMTTTVGPYFDTQLVFLQPPESSTTHLCEMTLLCTLDDKDNAILSYKEATPPFYAERCVLGHPREKKNEDGCQKDTHSTNQEDCFTSFPLKTDCESQSHCMWKDNGCRSLYGGSHKERRSCLVETAKAHPFCCKTGILTSTVKHFCEVDPMTFFEAENHCKSKEYSGLCPNFDEESPPCLSWSSQRCTTRDCCTLKYLSSRKQINRDERLQLTHGAKGRKPLHREGSPLHPVIQGMQCNRHHGGLLEGNKDFAVDYRARCELVSVDAFHQQWVWSCAKDNFENGEKITDVVSDACTCQGAEENGVNECSPPPELNSLISGDGLFDNRSWPVSSFSKTYAQLRTLPNGREEKTKSARWYDKKENMYGIIMYSTKQNFSFPTGFWFQSRCVPNVAQWYEREQYRSDQWPEFPFRTAEDPPIANWITIVCNKGTWTYDYTLLHNKADWTGMYSEYPQMLTLDVAKRTKLIPNKKQVFPHICVPAEKYCANVKATWARMDAPVIRTVKKEDVKKGPPIEIRCLHESYIRRIGSASNYDIEYFTKRYTGSTHFNVETKRSFQYLKDSCDVLESPGGTDQGLNITARYTSTVYELFYGEACDEMYLSDSQTEVDQGRLLGIGIGLYLKTMPPGPAEECQCTETRP